MKPIHTTKALLIAAALAVPFALPFAAEARIKLITLPVRERVEVQLDNPTTTLVEEERIVPLTKGINQVDFSWANTTIDPETIVFRVLGPVEGKKFETHVLSVSYPPNEQSLVWQVSAGDAGSARVRISYVLGNLSKSFNYRAVAANDEKTLTLFQYLRLQNFANEEFEGAHTGVWAGFGKQFMKPVGINETKQMLAGKFEKVPIEKTYTCDVAQFGYTDQPQKKLRVPMHYVIVNSKAGNLGQAALPYGKVRIFQDDGKETTAFIGEDWGLFTPIDDKMKLYLGVAQDISVKRTIEKSNRVRIAGNLFNQEVTVKYEIENFKEKDVTLDVVEKLPQLRAENFGNSRNAAVQWDVADGTTFEGGLDPDPAKTTCDQATFHAKLPAAKEGKATKIIHKFVVVFKNEW
jgi:hypothetical protein